jgi:hypothetical protein
MIITTHNEQHHIADYLDGLYPGGHLRQAKVNALRELQSHKGMISASGEELRRRRTLMPSILDKAFKREL